ncbi:MAG: hypothetical protein RL318_542 [Fibrobacterota bacterium]|jgi:arabinoxylan arabinofuranohydrolase
MLAKRSSTLFALVLSGLAVDTLADNPVVSHRQLADPNAFVFNDRLYTVCSNDDDNGTGYDMKSAVVISTKDLMNWTDHGDVFRTTRDAKWAGGSYAPTATVVKGKVYLYFPNVTSGVGVLTADRPEGPYKDPLGKALISGSTLCPMAWCFDPGVFVNTDGAGYLVWGGGTPYGDNLMGIALNADMISLKGSPTKITVPNSFEGPFVHKYKNNYYLHYPISGGANLEYSMSSTSPISGYVRKGVVLPNPSLNGKNINQNDNSHASILEYKGSWYMMYHDRRLPTGSTYKRDVSIDKLEYDTDGTMKQVVVTSGMAQLANFNPYDSIPAATMSKQRGIKAVFNATNWINALVPQTSGSWIRLSGVDFASGAKEFRVNAATTASNVSVEIRTGSETGPVAGTCTVAKTASGTAYSTSTCAVTGLTGVKDVFLKFVNTTANANFAWYRFVPQTTGIATAPASRLPKDLPSEIEAFDLEGRRVRSFLAPPDQTPAQAWTAHGRGLPAGAYVLRIKDGSGVREQRMVQSVR